MKEIIANLFTAIFLTVACLLPIGLIVYVIWKAIKRLARKWMDEEDEYMVLHDEIQKDMGGYSVDEARAKLNKLVSLKWKDREKTSVLYTQFIRKFYAYSGEDCDIEEDIVVAS